MPPLPSRFDFLDYLHASPQIQQDFTPRIGKNEAKRGAVIHDFLATQNGLATSRIRGLNPTNMSKGVSCHQETGGEATMQRARQLALLLGHCNQGGYSTAVGHHA